MPKTASGFMLLLALLAAGACLPGQKEAACDIYCSKAVRAPAAPSCVDAAGEVYPDNETCVGSCMEETFGLMPPGEYADCLERAGSCCELYLCRRFENTRAGDPDCQAICGLWAGKQGEPTAGGQQKLDWFIKQCIFAEDEWDGVAECLTVSLTYASLELCCIDNRDCPSELPVCRPGPNGISQCQRP